MSYDSRISQCNNDINLYRNLRNKLSTISGNLSSASNSATDINGKLSIYYLINDGESNLGGRAKNLSSDIDATNTTIVNKVIPAIDSKISNLKSEIRELERQKAKEEAERREKERREREERERNNS